MRKLHLVPMVALSIFPVIGPLPALASSAEGVEAVRADIERTRDTLLNEIRVLKEVVMRNELSRAATEAESIQYNIDVYAAQINEDKGKLNQPMALEDAEVVKRRIAESTAAVEAETAKLKNLKDLIVALKNEH